MTATVIVRGEGGGRIDVRRGGWRRPRLHRSRGEIVGLVLWWLVVGALAAASVIFIIKQP